MSKFSPRLDVLPDAQRRLWGELSAIPQEFTLYRGTALALRLGHRKSVDFDFFATRTIEVTALEREIPLLSDAKVIQRAKNTLTVLLNRGADVQISFFGVPKLPRLAEPAVAQDNGIKIASLLDLAGTKASVVQVRGEAKDYIDIDALIQTGGVSLPFALAAAQKLSGPSFNPEITLKALSYFDDGDLRRLPKDLKFRLASAVEKVDLDHLPSLEDFQLRKGHDRGFDL